MPAPTSQEILVDLKSPNVTLEEAEDMLVELIDWRRADGVERWKVGRELDSLSQEVSPYPANWCHLPARRRSGRAGSKRGWSNARPSMLFHSFATRLTKHSRFDCVHLPCRPWQMPERLGTALGSAKDRTMFSASTLSCVLSPPSHVSPGSLRPFIDTANALPT